MTYMKQEWANLLRIIEDPLELAWFVRRMYIIDKNAADDAMTDVVVFTRLKTWIEMTDSH